MHCKKRNWISINDIYNFSFCSAQIYLCKNNLLIMTLKHIWGIKWTVGDALWNKFRWVISQSVYPYFLQVAWPILSLDISLISWSCTFLVEPEAIQKCCLFVYWHDFLVMPPQDTCCPFTVSPASWPIDPCFLCLPVICAAHRGTWWPDGSAFCEPTVLVWSQTISEMKHILEVHPVKYANLIKQD